MTPSHFNSRSHHHHPFILVQGMLIRVCFIIIMQSSILVLSQPPSCSVNSVCSNPCSLISLDSCHLICPTRGVIRPPCVWVTNSLGHPLLRQIRVSLSNSSSQNSLSASRKLLMIKLVSIPIFSL
ncbi:unnamed protein product [Protopolystoma xenopodis]|uniref:Uncharacterized protein n=1 Tax=Protopolystoma xenopodis TaxID=117903 RepID=A0A448XLI6_9PLAT|nr:unnamed protein product [Protopolystoma xenopodis]